jgi:hypothetical protein
MRVTVAGADITVFSRHTLSLADTCGSSEDMGCCGNERLRKVESKGSKSSNFELQKAVAIALPPATGLRNEALWYDFGRLV